MSGHLTDEQFAELLAGEETETVAELHLEACKQCRHELADLREAAGEFNMLSLAWAQVEAPRRIAPPTRFERLVSRGGPVWALGLTTALAAGMVTIHMSLPNSVERQGAAAASTTVSSSSELAADNRLMQSIDNALQYRSEPAVPVHELRGSVRRIAQPTTVSVAN